MKKTTKLSAPVIGSIISSALREKRPVTVGTYCEPDTKSLAENFKKPAAIYFSRYKDKLRKIKGYFECHAYAVIETQGKQVKLYNPHGYEVEPPTELKFLEDYFQAITIGPKLDRWM